MKVVLIDYISPIVYIPIINFYINKLYNKFDNIYLEDNIKSKVSKKPFENLWAISPTPKFPN